MNKVTRVLFLDEDAYISYALILVSKECIQLFSLKLWVNIRAMLLGFFFTLVLHQLRKKLT